MTPIPDTSNPREAAYLALLASLRNERYISETLEQWNQTCSPATLDFHFAQQMAYGACQMALSLDYFAECLAEKKALSLKQKERALLRLALYQYFYLDRIPLYAITDETIKIARKFCHRIFANYLNATLRQLSHKVLELPQGDSARDLSIHYSFPVFFVKQLIENYGLEKAKELLSVGNTPSIPMVRLRSGRKKDNKDIIFDNQLSVAIVRESSELQRLKNATDVYIQNATPAKLLVALSKNLKKPPERILDLCASPGGKLIAIHDLYPNSHLYANDVSEEKIKRLKENCQKYQIPVQISCGPGEKFVSSEKFDLIILDAPCSNSGVLNKRPEARWRLSQEGIDALQQIQLRILEHAKTLLAPQGQLWYMTCSILKKENEELISGACMSLGLEMQDSLLILPNTQGWDGGFACSLKISLDF